MKDDSYYVYFLLKRKEIIYIGCSKNVHVRLHGHLDKPHNSIRFVKCQSKESALFYEKRLINFFKPKLNINGIDTVAQKQDVINVKVTEHLKAAIIKQASKVGLQPSTYIREVVKKYIRYKEPDLI